MVFSRFQRGFRGFHRFPMKISEASRGGRSGGVKICFKKFQNISGNFKRLQSIFRGRPRFLGELQ